MATSTRPTGTTEFGPCFIISDSLQIIGLRQKATQLGVNSRVPLRQQVELAVYALVGFGDLSRTLRNQSLRRMVSGEIGCAADFVDVVHHVEQTARFAEILSRLVEMLTRFRRHKSIPSRRISLMSDVRSS